MNVEIKPGDFFFVNSNKTGAKIVKFFMTAPNWVVHLWRKIRKTQEVVEYYHAGMMKNQDEIIEQQMKVVQKSSKKILSTHNKVFIFRIKGLTNADRLRLIEEAEEDLGKGYDILNCFGKFFTWLTGIPLFAMYMEYPDQEVCINRIAQWAKNAVGITFGAWTHSQLTTHIIYKFVKSHPDLFEIVYEGVPADEEN